MTEVLTAEAAALELLDHVGEEVAIGLILPGGVPWAGGSGVLGHTGRQLMEMASGSNEMFYFSEEERDEGRSTAERLLRQEDYAGEFMVDGFTFPFGGEHVAGVWRTEGLRYPGLDFTIGTKSHPAALTLRVTFVEACDGRVS